VPALALAWVLCAAAPAAVPVPVAAADSPAHVFPAEQCGSCHLFPTRDGTFLRSGVFRGEIDALCCTCHENERAGVGHRTGMAPSMHVPEDFPLDADGRLTCATCHDPHAVDGPFPYLLRRPPGRALCELCHARGLPDTGRSIIAVTFPPDGAVLPPGETVVAGTVATAAATEVTLSTPGATVTAPVVGGTFAARIALGPGRTVVFLSAGSSRTRLTLSARAAAPAWKPHLTADAGQCAPCHPGSDEAGFFRVGPVGEVCAGCHGRRDRLPYTHRPSALGECTACHDPHGGGRGLAAGAPGAGCLRCHDRSAAALHIVRANAGLARAAVGCGDCHDAHQSTREHLTTSGPAALAVPVELEAPEPAGGDAALAGFAFTDDPGRPRLPEKIVALAVPPGADPATARLRVIFADQRELPGTRDVLPAPPAAAWAGGRALLEWGRGRVVRGGRDQAVYAADAPWPRAALSLERGADYRGLGIVRVAFRPLQFNPARRTLTLTRRVVAEVTFEPAHAPRTAGRLGAARATAASASVAAAASVSANDLGIGNAALATAVLEGAADGSGSSPASAAAAGAADYVVVTTRAIAAASAQLRPFVDHKTARGYAVRVVTEDDYGASAAGAARALAVRRWLQDNYAALGIRYVLLVGDPNPETGDVPMLRAWPRRGATTNTAYLDAPTDAFFADLTGNWDLDGNGYYGEYNTDRGAGGVDFVPEVFVGRVPVYGDVAALDEVLRKTMAYENDGGDLAWRRSVLLPMSFSDAGTDGAWLAEQMKSGYLVGRGFAPWTLYQQGAAGGADSAFASDEELRGGAVAARWGAVPYGVVAWWGHGSSQRTMIGYSGAWDGNLIEAPTSALNDAAPAFVYQTACLNGYPELEGNLGYALLRRGAVATVAASRVSWYLVGQTDFRGSASNAGIGYQYVARLTAGESAGKALQLAKGDPTVSHESATSWMNLMDFNLYGDPSVSLFHGPLLQLSPAAVALTAAEGEQEPVVAGVAVGAGDGSVAFQASADAAWLSASPATGAAPATVTVSARPAGLAPGAYAGGLVISGAAAGNSPLTLPVTLQVTSAGRVSGRVLTAAGSGVQGATVALQGPRAGAVLTDAAGAYGFAPLPPGSYTVTVSGTGFTFAPASAAAELTEGASLVRDFTGGSLEIRGRVTRASGRPLARVAVQLRTLSGVVVRQVLTKADGTYVMTRVAPGAYRLRAKLSTFRFTPAPVALTLTADSLSGQDFTGRR
jgi:predicted CXXCH cytochrome family protein